MENFFFVYQRKCSKFSFDFIFHRILMKFEPDAHLNIVYQSQQVWSPNVRCIPTSRHPPSPPPPSSSPPPPSSPPSPLLTTNSIPSFTAAENRRFRGFEKNALPTDGRTDGRTDGPTDRRTDEQRTEGQTLL